MSAGIVVMVEQRQGAVADISFEILGAGRKIGDALHAPVYAVVLGRETAAAAARLGAADAVLAVEDAALEVPSPDGAASILKLLAEQKQAALVLLGGTNGAVGIGPRLAAAAKLPFVNFCKGMRAEDGALVLTSQLFGGKILADVRLPDGRGVVSVSSGAFPADAGRSDRTPAVENVDVPVPASKVVFRKFLVPEASDVDITKQDVLVAVGRGIQTQDNITLAEELAQTLGGAVCASRPVIDQGWLSSTRQVGKSGMTVKPKLYLALGISGAPEHQEGMKDSPLIIAVNTDPKAPIFDIAHYGATVDLFELVPALKDAVEQRKAKA